MCSFYVRLLTDRQTDKRRMKYEYLRGSKQHSLSRWRRLTHAAHARVCSARRTECRAVEGGTAANCTSGTYLVRLSRWKLCDDDDDDIRARKQRGAASWWPSRGNRLKTRRDNFRRRPGREPRGPGLAWPGRRRRRRPGRAAERVQLQYPSTWVGDTLLRALHNRWTTMYGVRTTNDSVTLWGIQLLEESYFMGTISIGVATGGAGKVR